MIKTKLPVNFYSLFPKIIVLASLFTLAFQNLFLAIGIGILSGLLLHIWVSYYDCMVTLNGTTIKFVFLRPFLFKEEHDLLHLDNVEIVKDNAEKNIKEMWWLADSAEPISYDLMILYKNGIIHKIKFRTNQNDLPLLKSAIKDIFLNKGNSKLS